MLKMSNPFQAKLISIAKRNVITRPVSPHNIKMDFIKVDSGSIPTNITTLLHGPSWPAYSPDLGLT